MSRPHRLTATELAASVAAGRLTSVAVVEDCLARIAAREPVVGAWEHLDPEQARAQARALDAGPIRGPLHGVPIGVKDIIDTADMPTAYGTAIYAGHRPPWDASCVALVRAAGAVVLGKTVTTELACFAPGRTANPHDPSRTPGGSSSGSAAAVADCMVPLAFGSQTAASVIRPAAYCGIAGFKATHGRYSLAGIKTLAHTLDSLGWVARCVDDLALLRAVLAGEPAAPLPDPPAPRIGLCRTPEWEAADEATRAVVERTSGRLEAAGAAVVDVTLPPEFDGLVDDHKTIMAFEAARAYAFESKAHRSRLSPRIMAMLEAGEAVAPERYEAAQARSQAARRSLVSVMEGCDALIAPSAPGEAPRGLAGTGDPVFSRMWSLLHVPSVNLPAGVGEAGMPLGVQVVALQERRLLAVARWIEHRLA